MLGCAPRSLFEEQGKEHGWECSTATSGVAAATADSWWESIEGQERCEAYRGHCPCDACAGACWSVCVSEGV